MLRPDSLFNYFYISPWHVWKVMFSRKPNFWNEDAAGVFKNLPGVIPGRWGIYFYGIEIGSRNPGDPVGVWLKEKGLWPW